MLRYILLIFIIITVKFNIGLYAQSVITGTASHLKIVSQEITDEPSNFYTGFYVDNHSLNLRSRNIPHITGQTILVDEDRREYYNYSQDNGVTWEKKLSQPDFTSDLPFGFRRDATVSILDSNNGRIMELINSLDVKDLDPSIHEPPVAQNTFYVRYRVSEDSGNNWLFDEPIIHKGRKYTKSHPLPGVFINKNGFYIGDLGSIPIVTKKGKILVPVQNTALDDKGELYNPNNALTFTDALVLIGSWKKNGRISWKMSDRIKGDPERSTRGMIEPTILEIADDQIMMVMRGSNSNAHHLPSYKWISVSKNGGKNWSVPEPFTFEDGSPFYSPSAMSTLFKHSSGRCFWIGNMSNENCEGNSPRWPLVMVEVNRDNMKLIKNSLLVLDTYTKKDESNGRLDLSHFWLLEDRVSNEIILTYPRSSHSYKSKKWVMTRISVD